MSLMGYIDIRKNRIKAQLARIDTALSSLYTQLGEQAVTAVQSYQFDSGDGSQRTTRRKYDEIQNQIERLEAEYDHYLNELYNMGIITTQLRRKSC